jgi:MFS family permease
MTSLSAAIAETPMKLPARYVGGFLIASLVLYAAMIAPVAFSLAVRLEQINALAKNGALALAIGIPGIAVLVTGPLVGVLSDRTISRFGRRRLWFLAGTLLGFIGSLLVGAVHSIPMAILGWTAAYIGYTAALGMLTTHLGDRLPESQRGRVGGFISAISQIGPVVGIVLAGRFVSFPFVMLAIPAVMGLAGGLFFAIVMKDPMPIDGQGKLDIKVILEGFWFNPRTHRNFLWVWLSRALVYLSISFTSVYTVYLLTVRLHAQPGALANLVATAGLAGLPIAIFGAVASGWLSDRVKRRKPFLVVSAILMGAGALIVGTLTGVPQFFAGTLVSAFGIGVYNATDQAMVLDVLPREEGQNGRYLAIIALANQLAQAAGPFLAGMVIRYAGGNYSWVYFSAAAFAVLGALLILPVQYVWRQSTVYETDVVGVQH